jgi:hypothetical protein
VLPEGVAWPDGVVEVEDDLRAASLQTGPRLREQQFPADLDTWTARFGADGWRNSAILISPAGEVRWYDKNTLNADDSRHFVAGSELPVFELDGVPVLARRAV